MDPFHERSSLRSVHSMSSSKLSHFRPPINWTHSNQDLCLLHSKFHFKLFIHFETSVIVCSKFKIWHMSPNWQKLSICQTKSFQKPIISEERKFIKLSSFFLYYSATGDPIMIVFGMFGTYGHIWLYATAHMYICLYSIWWFS